LLIIFAALLLIAIFNKNSSPPAESDLERQQREVREEKAAAIADFQQHKSSILQTAAKLERGGDLAAAARSLHKYDDLVHDADLKSAAEHIDDALLRDALKHASDHKTRINVLKQIHEESPPDDVAIMAQTKTEQAALAADQEKLAERTDRLSKLGLSEFCSSFRRHPKDEAFLADFRDRGGRDQWASYIGERQIAMGMNEFEIRCAWGPPDHMNTTLIGNSLEEKQLIYGDSPSTYLYLRNGVMVSLQKPN